MLDANGTNLQSLMGDSLNVIAITENDNSIGHYFLNGEYEMSFELLIMELMTKNVYPNNFVFSEWEKLAIAYNLQNENVYSLNWDSFIKWGKGFEN